MNANRDLIASLFTTIKRFRKNKECKQTIRELRRQIRLLTPIDSFCKKYYSTDGTKQILMIGNMEDSNTVLVYPKDCWIDNVLDLINKKTDILHNKVSDIRDVDGKYYNRNKWFLLDGKAYSKDKFTLIDNKAVSNTKICYIGPDFSKDEYNGENVYVFAKENEEFITTQQLLKMYAGTEDVLSLSSSKIRTNGLSLLGSCLLFRGKYRLSLNAIEQNIYLSKQMLQDCEFSFPEGYEEAKTKVVDAGVGTICINSYCYLSKRALINQMWNELINRNPHLQRWDFTVHFESYFKNLIAFAKKEAEYAKQKDF